MMQDEWLSANTGFIENDDHDSGDENGSFNDSMVTAPMPMRTSTPEAVMKNDLSALMAPGMSSMEDFIQERHRPAYCIFVASLSSARTDVELYKSVRDMFSQFGHVYNVKVLRDPKQRPYAFVQYGNDSDAENALTLGHRSVIDGRQVRCERARVNRTILVCSDSVDQRVTYRTATELGSRYGEVESIINFQGTLGGGMFIQFAFRDDAAKAFIGLQQEAQFRVHWVQNVSKPEPTPTYDNQLFLGHLPADVTEDEIRSKFGKFGMVLGVEIIQKPKHNNVVHAFVQFDNYLSVVQAIEHTNHTLWKDRAINVQFREKRQPRPQLAPAPNHSRAAIGGYNNQSSRSFSGFQSQYRVKQPRNHGSNSRPSYHHHHKSKFSEGKENKPTEKQHKGIYMASNHSGNNFYPMYYMQPSWGMYPQAPPNGQASEWDVMP